MYVIQACHSFQVPTVYAKYPCFAIDFKVINIQHSDTLNHAIEVCTRSKFILSKNVKKKLSELKTEKVHVKYLLIFVFVFAQHRTTHSLIRDIPSRSYIFLET